MNQSERITTQSIFEMLMESQYWSPETLLEFQRWQLEQLLRHARANVPFYKSRLNCMFRGDDSIDWERWTEIPVLTRTDVQKHRADLLARELPDGHGTWREFSTSGSTALPIEIRVPSIMSQVGRAAWSRFYHAHGISQDTCFSSIRTTLPDGVPLHAEFHESEGRTVAGKARHITIARFQSGERKLELLSRFAPDVLIESPNGLEILARENLKRAKPVHVRWVVGYGMGVSPEQSRLLQESFSATVLTTYCTKECGPIALQCPRSSNFHVNEELMLVEQQFNRAQNIVVTPLFQSAQPLIRYQQNDMVHMSPACSCGHKHLTITKVDGRVDSIFKLPDGKQVAAMGVGITWAAVAKSWTAVQLAQTAPLDFEVRYMADTEVSAEDAQSITKKLHSEIHPEMRVTYHRVDDIPANQGGKQQRFVREFDLA